MFYAQIRATERQRQRTMSVTGIEKLEFGVDDPGRTCAKCLCDFGPRATPAASAFYPGAARGGAELRSDEPGFKPPALKRVTLRRRDDRGGGRAALDALRPKLCRAARFREEGDARSVAIRTA